MPTQTTTELFLLDDLETPKNDLSALRVVADWIKTFVARPNEHLGRAGPVSPSWPEPGTQDALARR
jgi:hypothetical protein